MKMSDAGLEFLKAKEGFKNRAYRDIYGYWTCGVGHLITPNEPELITAILTDAQVMDLLRKDVERIAERAVNKMGVDFNQNQYDAACSFAFNIGGAGLTRSKFYAFCKAGDFKAASAALRAYGGDKRPRGLANRRNAEADLFDTP